MGYGMEQRNESEKTEGEHGANPEPSGIRNNILSQPSRK